jgi:hypothetical protein
MQLGASRASRQWPAQAFGALGKRLARSGHRVMLIGGAGDRPLARAVAAEVGAGVVDACGRTSVGELGGLLTRAAVLVTGDTGPMHMAVAVGTPVVALFFGPASPFDTGPYSADNVVLHTGAPCAPCSHTVTCLNPFCREEIDADLVADAVRARLAGDWHGLGALARAHAGLHVYRTGFDAQGLYRCDRLGRAASRPEDELRWAYRATWMAELLRTPLPAPRATSIATAPFAGLASLAVDGAAATARLRGAALASNPDLDEIERLGRGLDVLDQALVVHGHTHADTEVLTQMFRFGKENLEGEDVAALAAETEELYRALARQATMMGGLLAGRAAEKERRDDAHLHQPA